MLSLYDKLDDFPYPGLCSASDTKCSPFHGIEPLSVYACIQAYQIYMRDYISLTEFSHDHGMTQRLGYEVVTIGSHMMTLRDNWVNS